MLTSVDLGGLGLEPPAAGFYVGLMTLPSLISGILIGTLSDRTGRRSMMLLCLIVSGLMVSVLAPLREGVIFGAALIVVGLFLFSVRPVLFAQAMDLTRAQVGGTTVSFLFGINMLFSSLSPFMAGWLADQAGLGTTFYLSGGLILAAALLTTRLPTGKPTPKVALAA